MLNGDKIFRKEMIKCALCMEPKCSSGCNYNMDPGKKLLSIWFDNSEYAASILPDNNLCLNCQSMKNGGNLAGCESNCIHPGEVKIRDLMLKLYRIKEEEKESTEIDFACLKTDICGVELENPFVLSSSVVASTYDMCARAFEMGWAGVSFKTICTLEIHEASPRFSALEGDNGGFIGFKNIEQLSDHSVAENMEIFRRLKENYPTKVIIASIMGQDEEEWESLARECEENGADVIELNFSCPNMMAHGMGSDIGQNPDEVEQFTRAAKRGCSIPVLAKLTPNVAEMSTAAEAALRGGADGIAAINTIKSITGVNLYTFVSAPAVHGKSAFGGYSGAAVKPIALKFIAELGKNQNLEGMHISGMGGIENWTDAAEFILLGAESIQITTAVMKYGYRIVDDLKTGLALYMNQMGFKSLKEMKGLGLEAVDTSTDAIERDTIVYPRLLREKCLGCGRCVLSCRDGGHQALSLSDKDGKVTMNAKACVGCHLCTLVCPEDAIVPGRKRV